MRGILLGACVLAALPVSAMAQGNSDGLYFGPTVDLGGAFGGNKVATVIFTNGDSENIRAGQGVTIDVGGFIRPSFDSPFELRATIGDKYESTSANNADIYLNRLTWEFLPSYRFTRHFSVGVGAVGNFQTKFHQDYFGPTVDFKPAVGPRFQLAWMSSPTRFIDAGVALTYDLMHYHYNDSNGNDQSLSANSIGLRLILNFGVCCSSARTAYAPVPTYTPPPATYTVPAAPPPADSMPPPPPPPPSSPAAANSATAQTLFNGAALRNQPVQGSPVAQPMPVGTPVQLVFPLANASGSWWYVKTQDGNGGWLLQNEVGPLKTQY